MNEWERKYKNLVRKAADEREKSSSLERELDDHVAENHKLRIKNASLSQENAHLQYQQSTLNGSLRSRTSDGFTLFAEELTNDGVSTPQKGWQRSPRKRKVSRSLFGSPGRRPGGAGEDDVAVAYTQSLREIDALRGKLAVTEAELKAAREDKERAEKHDGRDDVRDLVRELSIARKEVNSLQSAVSGIATSPQGIEKTIRRLQQRADRAETRANGATVRAEQLGAQLAASQQPNRVLEEKLRDADVRLSTATAQSKREVEAAAAAAGLARQQAHEAKLERDQLASSLQRRLAQEIAPVQAALENAQAAAARAEVAEAEAQALRGRVRERAAAAEEHAREMEVLQDKLAVMGEHEHTLKQLRTENRSLLQSVEELTHGTKVCSEEVARARERITELEERLVASQRQASALAEEGDRVKNANTSLRRKVADMELQLQLLTTQQQFTNAELGVAREHAVSSAGRAAGDPSATEQAFAEEMQSMVTACAQAQAEVARLQEEKMHLTSELAVAAEGTGALEESVSGKQEQLTVIRDELEQAQRMAASASDFYEAKIASLEAQLSAADNEIEEHKAEQRRAQNDNDGLLVAVAEGEDRIVRLEGELEHTRLRNDALNTMLEDEKRHLAEVFKEAESSRVHLLSKYEAALAEASTRKSSRDAQLQKCVRDLEESRAVAVSLEDKAATFKAERDHAVSELHMLATAYNELHAVTKANRDRYVAEMAKQAIGAAASSADVAFLRRSMPAPTSMNVPASAVAAPVPRTRRAFAPASSLPV